MPKTNAKKLRTLVLAAALVTSFQVIGVEHEDSVSSDTSKNPITGTVTQTRKYKKHVKRADGKTGHVNVEEKTKYMKDGSVEQKVDADSQTLPPTK